MNSTLFPLGVPNAPFVPFLSAAPNDWSVALSYSTNAGGVRSLAIDSTGNVWTGNGNNNISELSPVGVPASGTPFVGGGNIANPYGLAFDTGGTLWVANHDSNQLIALNAVGVGAGNSIAGPFTYSGSNAPSSIAIDGHNNIWITNGGNSTPGTTVTETNAGNPSNGVALSGGGVINPSAVAIDGAGNGWITNRTGSTVTEFNTSDTFISGSNGYVGGGLNFPIGIAMDGSNNAWVINAGNTLLSKFTSSGTPVGSGFSTGTGAMSAVAVDGSNRVFVLKRTPSLWIFDSTGTALASGLTGGNLGGPNAMVMDASGNVWVADLGPVTVNSAQQGLTEFVGLATPVTVPMSMAQQIGQIGQKPGTPIPVSVVSSFLPSYTTGVQYSANLLAQGGNTGTYKWSVNSGGLPTGLNLSTAGNINGTTSVTGTTSFTVKACDAQNATNCAVSGTLSLTAASSLPVGGGESMLNGSYVLRFNGYNNNMAGNHNGFVSGYAETMQLSFNGSGGITAGEYDFNNPGSHPTTVNTVTGSYTLGTDQRGLMVISLSNGGHFEYALSVGNLNGSSVAQDVRFIEFDDTFVNGSAGTGAGVGKLQSGLGSFSMAQSFVFGLEGETPCNTVNGNTCPNGLLSDFGPVTAVGRFTGDGSLNITSGQEDAQTVGNGNGSNNGNNGFGGISLAGSYTAPDAAGRGTLTLTPTASGVMYPLPPSHYVYYVVSPTEMYIMSTDLHLNFTMLSGDVLAQTVAFTGASQLSGNYVLYGTSPSNGDGVSNFPDQSGVQLIGVVTSGSQITVTQDSNNENNGQVQLGEVLGTLPYAIDSVGRLTLTGAGNHPPIFYLASLQQGVAVGGGGAGLIHMEQQSAGPFSCNLPAGTYSLGNVESPVRQNVNSGVVVQNGSGTGALTIDNSDPSGVLTQGQTASLTCVADANGINTASSGRFSFTGSVGTTVGYVISPTKSVVISTTAGEPTPNAIVIQK